MDHIANAAPSAKEKQFVDLHDARKFGRYIFFPSLILYGIPYVVIWADEFSVDFFGSQFYLDLHPVGYLIVALMIFLIGVVMHELIHGVFFALFASGGWKSIRFGVGREHGIAYCHCTEPMKVKHYMISAAMPFLLLGLLPVLLSWTTGGYILLVFGWVFTVTAIGDLMIIDLVRRLNKNTYIQDHPTEIGYFVYPEEE